MHLMETRFQTSFIPKKSASPLPGGGLTPLSSTAAPHHQGIGLSSIYMAVAIILFAVSVLSIGGVFIWRGILESSQQGYIKQYNDSKTKINPDQISFLKAQSAKIHLARQLVSNHLVASKIFSVISTLTDENVRFLSMDMTVPATAQTPFRLSLSGYGKSLPSVAFQSDVLNSLEKYGLHAVVKNAIVSDPVLNRDGTVSFGFTAQIDPNSFLYPTNVNTTSAPVGTTTNK